MTVLVAHPTRQHSHRLAMALHQAGLLHSYWTLLPDRRSLSWWPSRLDGVLPSAISRHSLAFLPAAKVHVLLGPLILQKLGARFESESVAQLGEWAAWAAFDRWVAAQLPRLRPSVVVGYEMCSMETFKVAKSLGIGCILDAAAFHYSFQDQVLRAGRTDAITWAGRRLRQRKRIEIDLADKIVCVSEIAQRSYVDAGVDIEKMVVNQVGCDIKKFRSKKEAVRTGPPKFVFIGMPSYHKGFDLLVSAYGRLLQKVPGAELHVVGDAGMAERWVAGGLVRLYGKLSHEEISDLLAGMDCLVLPSRLESFGMVAIEALAAGVSVIISDHAGACDVINEGYNGWIVPAGDKAALFRRLLECSQEIQRVRSMSEDCAASALLHDWSHYSTRALNLVGSIAKEIS